MIPPILASHIHAVMVFVSGALVTRHADLATLDSRVERVRITGLPLCLEDGSLRVAIAGTVVVASDVQVALDVPPADAALPPPQDAEVIAARRAAAEAQTAVSVLAAQRERLDQITILERPVAQRGAPPDVSPTAARLALVEFVSRRGERLAVDIAAAAEIQRLADERLAELEARAAAATTARQARPDELRKSALVTLRWNGTGAPLGALTLEYRVPGARWMPTYVVRFADGMRQATVEMRAALAQASGEDWNGVQLTLSSADGIAWHALPDLASRRIGRAQSRPPSVGWRSAPEGAEALYADYDREHQRCAQQLAMLGEAPAVGGAMAEESAEVASDEEERRPAKSKKMDRTRGCMEREKSMSASVAMPLPAPVMSAPAPAAMAKPMAMESAVRKSRRVAAPMRDESDSYGSGGAPGSPPAEPEPPSELDPSAWLAYGRLRLGGFDDAHRGRLRQAKSSEGYLSLLVEQHVAVTLSVPTALRDADSRALEPQQLSAPAAHATAPQAGRFAHVYPASLPVSLASDGAWHVVPVCGQDTAVEVGHVCVPREAREVFRTVRFTNPLSAPLPAGPVDCYAGERYLMTVPLSGVDTGGAVTIGLGVEPGITVARNTSVAERAGGMLGGTLNVDHRIRIRVANKLQQPVAIAVRERLPVSRSDECTVKSGEVKPPWTPFAQPEAPIVGGHCWQITVAPAAEIELAADYTVSFPAKHEIAGGNRREGA